MRFRSIQRYKYGEAAIRRLTCVVIPMRFRSIQRARTGRACFFLCRTLVVIPMRFRSIQSRWLDWHGLHRLRSVVIPMRFRSIQSILDHASRAGRGCRNPYEIQVNTKQPSLHVLGHAGRVVIPMRFRSIQSSLQWELTQCDREVAAVVIPMRFRSIQRLLL